ncbi:MAG: DNA-binding protein [Candidatus Hodarchaeales archaeon]|jgi:programmed cell death protein 5
MVDDDRELEELRKRRLEKLQNDQLEQQQLQQQQEEQRRQVENQRQLILKGILTDEARERLGRIKLAKPEFAASIENQLIQLAASRRIAEKINDDQLKTLLKQMDQSKRESRITFKRR